MRINIVAYSTYFNTLRTDVAGGSADDIFWLSNAYLAAYADSGRLMNIGKTLGADAAAAWEPAVVDQFTRGGALWGVPQLTDAGIAVYYNADLLAAAGVDPAQLNTLRWDPSGDDTLRPLLARLTLDADGNAAGTPRFDGRRVRQWGYNAANDPQAIYLNYIGSAGGVFQRGDEFAFDNPAAIGAFRYLVGLINDDHVAPPASDTNDNGDFSRNQFLAGRMALFQSGTYNLEPVAHYAQFRWGVAMLPAGPKGRVSVTNGIAAAGNSATKHPDAVRQVLAWMGSSEGNAYLGRSGAAIPAVLVRPAGLLTAIGPAGASTSRRSSPCWTARVFQPQAAPASPPETTRCTAISTRCSSAAATSRQPCARRRRRPTPRRAVSHSPLSSPAWPSRRRVPRERAVPPARQSPPRWRPDARHGADRSPSRAAPSRARDCGG